MATGSAGLIADLNAAHYFEHAADAVVSRG